MAITTLGLTGFEHGFIGAGAQNGGGLFDAAPGSGWTASTSSPRNGSYCAHLVAPANTATRLQNNVVGTPPQKVVERFAVKVTSRPSSGAATIAFLENAIPTVIATIQVSSTGVLTAFLVGGGTQTGPTIDTTGWHLIEFQVDTAAKTFDWKVDNVAQTRATTATAMNDVSRINLGTPVANLPAFTADYDDVIIGTWTVAGTDWYGDGKVLGQVAGVDGTHATITSLSPGDAGTAYSGTPTTVNTMVDDPPGTLGWTATRSTTDNIALRTATVGAYAAIGPATTAETGSANAVKAIMSYSSSATQANLAACDVRNSAGTVTELWGLTGGVGKAYNIVANQFKSAVVTQPAAGWTAAEVNAVRFRFGGCTSADISPVPTVQALMLEVDWPIAHDYVADVPLDETSIDTFDRADGPVYSGAGASVWETAGGLFNTSGGQATIAGNALAGTGTAGWANAKVQLGTSFDLVFDVSTEPAAGTFNVAFGLTDLLTAGVDGWWFQTAATVWGLYYYTNGTKGSALATASRPFPVAGSTIWIAKRDTVITVYYRVNAAAQYDRAITLTDARGNITSPFLFNVLTATGRLDNLRGGPLAPSGPQTLYGATSLATTFAQAIAARRETFSGLFLPAAFAAVTAGQVTVPAVTHYGTVARATSFGAITDGKRKTFGQVARPSSFAATTQAQRKTFGVVARPATYASTTAAQRKTFSSTVTPVSFGAITSGQATVPAQTYYGVVARATAFSATTQGQRRAFGVTAIPVGFAAVTQGRRRTTSTTATATSFTAVTAGRKQTFGVVARPATFGAVTAGRRRTTSQVAVPMSYAAVVQGQRKTFSSTATSLTLTTVTDGRRLALGNFGLSVMTVGFGATTQGRKKTFATVAVPSSFSATTQGRRKTFSTLAAPLTLGVLTQGVRRGLAVLGATSLPISFASTTQGRRRTFGLVSQVSTLGVATQGKRKTFGLTAIPLSLGASTLAQRKTHAASSLPLGVLILTNGRILVAYTVLNDARAVYLGDEAIERIYAGGELVWP